jgi:hypothetical protein
MADVEKLKSLLREGAARARKYASEQEVTEAVQELRDKVRVGKSDLLQIGQKVAQDPEIFASTDIDDINTVLSKGADQ